LAVGDDLVTIPRSELLALRASRERQEELACEASDRARKASDWERACKEAIRDRELATALAGRPLVPGSASQLIQLWRDDFDVIEVAGELRAVSRDGRPVMKAVIDRLSEPEYAHFSPPTSRGGSGS